MKQSIRGTISLVLSAIALALVGYALAAPAPQWQELDAQVQDLQRAVDMERGAGFGLASATLSTAQDRLLAVSDEQSELTTELETLTIGGLAAAFFALVFGALGLRGPAKGRAIGGLAGAAGSVGLVFLLLDTVRSLF